MREKQLANSIALFLIFQLVEGRKPVKTESSSLEDRLEENEEPDKSWTESEFELTLVPLVTILVILSKYLLSNTKLNFLKLL